ncbi:MAG: helix-turn-helix transcriptional regulator [Microbacterium sp.]
MTASSRASCPHSPRAGWRSRRSYVGQVERGERNISLDNIHRLAEALSVEPSALFGVPDGRRVEDRRAAGGGRSRLRIGSQPSLNCGGSTHSIALLRQSWSTIRVR